MHDSTLKSQSDVQARRRALEPQTSFIIQAPAGSGKTELLIQRFLVLLATVDRCEKILAITFTKKAAGEMRYRIHRALERASDPAPPSKDHERLTWDLARKAFSHAKKMGWPIALIANQLSIMTIDACCQKLLGMCQPPYLLYAQFSLCLYPKPFYAQAIKQFIQDHCIDETARHRQDFQALLLNQHHDYRRVEHLLQAALINREKWLRLTLSAQQYDFIGEFMQTIDYCQKLHIEKLLHIFSSEAIETITSILQRLSQYNAQMHIVSTLDTLAMAPVLNWELRHWQILASTLLTQSGTFRGLFTQKQGFANQTSLRRLSADDRAHYQSLKERFIEIFHTSAEQTDLQSLLVECHILPIVVDADSEWQCLHPLLKLLPSLAAYLQLQMNGLQMIDFAGINLQLLSALLDETQQASLSLQIYQSYQHLLIDEFQDTSVNQFEILELAFSAWHGEANRSITVVGDPMQSIYRFRQAEVKLFRQVQQHGFCGLSLQNLFLCRNYRSSALLIEQLNHCFQQFMTPKYNVFSPAEPVLQHEHSGIFWHQAESKNLQNVALCRLVQDLIQQHPQRSKCLLVRARSQLIPILPLFRQYGISYDGVGIHALSQCQAVLDCYHLLCLPMDYHDRKSWIAFLLSPAVALSIEDLYALSIPKQSTIWDNLATNQAQLSPSGQTILARVLPVLQYYLAHYGRHDHIDLAKTCWYSLGGDLATVHPDDLDSCEIFFSIARTLADSGQDINHQSLWELLNTYPEHGQQQQADIQVMTIHKSKGLEFDMVIMPNLEQSSPVSEKSLLDWTQIAYDSQWHLLMHSHPRHRQQSTSVHRFLRHQDKLAQLAEAERLYYVAFTRAKYQLHILNTQKSDFSDRSPMKNLAPILTQLFPEQSDTVFRHEGTDSQIINSQILSTDRWVLPVNWQHPLVDSKLDRLSSPPDQNRDMCLDAVDNRLNPSMITEDQWGTLIHRYIEIILKSDNIRACFSMKKFVQVAASVGIRESWYPNQLSILYQQLKFIQDDDRFHWIHTKTKNQLIEQTIIHKNKRYRVDCASVDHVQKTCWIIDFKTYHVSALLQTGKADTPPKIPVSYWRQLRGYAECFQALFPDYQIQAGLYYPLACFWAQCPEHDDNSATKSPLL